MTVVVDHDRGRVVWACAGHDKRQLNAFLGLLTEGLRAGIEVVTADGARRIADAVAERLPGAELAADPFHAASRATGALDEPRRRSWREAGSRPAPKAPPRAPAQGRAGPSRPGRAGEDPRGSRCSRTPRTSRRGRPRRSRGSRRPARRCGAATCPRKGCGPCSGPAPSARRASSTAGSPGRAGAGYRSSSSSPESQAQARRDPALHRARRLQRPRGGREQQDKGRDQAGLRLQEHGRPDRPHHAQVLGPEAGAAGEGGFVIPTHTNSRSLVNIADLFHRPWRVSF